MNFTATETTTRRQFTITAKTVPETELTKVAELVALIYKNSIPAIYGITQVKSNDNIILNYGSERNATTGQELEIYKFTDKNSIPIGSLEIKKVMIQSSICSISKLLTAC